MVTGEQHKALKKQFLEAFPRKQKIFQGNLKGYQIAHSFLVINHIIAISQPIIIFH